MYCDFCGKNLSYNVKYCRHCGRHLREGFGDTQPLPVINEIMLYNTKKEGRDVAPWYKTIWKKHQLEKKTILWKIIHGLFALGIVMVVIYVIATFKTMREYQILMGIIGSLFAVCTWWRGC